MYIPAAFEITDPVKIAEVISNHSFGMMISRDGDSLFTSHLPFLFKPEQGKHGMLTSHMAKTNRHWKLFNEQDETLIIFNGPHAYISPNWYAIQITVPTWNYVTVHAYGKPRMVSTEGELGVILEETVKKNESALPNPWTTSFVPDSLMTQLRNALVGFEMEITRVEGKFKLGQNRSPEDREKMLKTLQASGDSESMALAKFMEREFKEKA